MNMNIEQKYWFCSLIGLWNLGQVHAQTLLSYQEPDVLQLVMSRNTYRFAVGNTVKDCHWKHPSRIKGNVPPGSFPTWRIEHMPTSSLLSRKVFILNSQQCCPQGPDEQGVGTELGKRSSSSGVGKQKILACWCGKERVQVTMKTHTGNGFSRWE